MPPEATTMDQALHVMPEPEQSLTEMVHQGPEPGPRIVNLDAYRGKLQANEWLALQAFVEEVEIHAARHEMQRLVDLAVEVAPHIAPGRMQPFLDHMKALAQNREAELILADLEPLVQAFTQGIVTQADVAAARKVEPLWRIQELGRIARERLMEAQPSLFTQPAPQTKEASAATPAPEQTNLANPSTVPEPQPIPAPPGPAEPKGEPQPMSSIVQDEEALKRSKHAANRIREYYELPQIKEGLKQFLPSGADQGKTADLIQEKARLNKEIKAIRREVKRREVELEADANLPPVDADGKPLVDDKGKPVKLTVDQRKARFEQLKLEDPEYRSLQDQVADLEAQLEEANGLHEVAKDQLRALRSLSDLAFAELLVIGGY